MRKIKSTVRLTIFSTLIITSTIFILLTLLISDINADMARKGSDYAYGLLSPQTALLLITAAALAYFASSVIIDRIFNPIRLMINKVNEIGNMDFSKPLQINSQNDELLEYVTAFNNMSEKLKNYMEKQKRFISDASHELVTPITIINGHADLLLRRGANDPKMLASELKIIKSEALRMNELIEGLLLLARSDSGKQIYKFDRNNIAKLITESVSEAQIIAPDFIFETELEEANVKCDEYAIRRVMRILLSNAVKYSGESRLIQIKAWESHGLVNVCVTDYGIGIAQEHLTRIFDRFYRADDSRSKKTGSSGLGLAIAKELITAHGGEIRVESEPEKGTEFKFILSV